MRIDSTSNPRIFRTMVARMGPLCFTKQLDFVKPGIRQRINRLGIIGVLMLLTGCASTGGTGSVNDAAEPGAQLRADMIADLMSVLPQMLEPLNTTIQLSNSESGGAAEAVPKLVELGYGLQYVDADQGNNFLYLTDLSSDNNSNSDNAHLRLSIGGFELSRNYTTIQKNASIDASANLVWRNGRAIIPAGPLQVAGTRQSLQLTGINIELASADGDDFSPGSIEYATIAPIEGGIPTISLITEDLVSRVTVAASAGPSLASLKSSDDGFANIYNDNSAFASILDDYNRIVREFVIFPNDSQFLGKPGKTVVKKIVARFSENSDIIGITGCSNGPTGLAIGNEGLAIGRANRIAEELVSAGISRDRVFDEGCWSPTTDAPGFPNRGVVIDLYRRAG